MALKKTQPTFFSYITPLFRVFMKRKTDFKEQEFGYVMKKEATENFIPEITHKREIMYCSCSQTCNSLPFFFFSIFCDSTNGLLISANILRKKATSETYKKGKRKIALRCVLLFLIVSLVKKFSFHFIMFQC